MSERQTRLIGYNQPFVLRLLLSFVRSSSSFRSVPLQANDDYLAALVREDQIQLRISLL